jgi:formylglycine-generating enzyme required for sulfatase activity
MMERTIAGAWREAGYPPPLVVNDVDGSVLVYVPAGEFEMGDGQDRDCPKHQVSLDAYYIGLYCVTNAQYARFVQATRHRVPDTADYGTPVWCGRRYPPEQAEHPVTCVSWEDAVAYGAWAGLRLPTEAEWEHAARGPAGWVYPWGNAWDATRCRHGGKSGGETTCRVDAYPGGVSGYGTYNQAGNVWEWCADWEGADYYKQSPRANPRGPETGSYRVIRGGGWRDFIASYCRGAHRFRRVPAYRNDLLGFRLVRTAS